MLLNMIIISTTQVVLFLVLPVNVITLLVALLLLKTLNNGLKVQFSSLCKAPVTMATLRHYSTPGSNVNTEAVAGKQRLIN